MNIIFFILVFLTISFYYKRYRDLLHPNMIFLTMWFATCAISCIDYNDFMAPWSIEMYFVTIISGFSFFIGSILAVPSRSYNKNSYMIHKIQISSTYRKIMYSLYIICISCAILEWINGGAVISLSLVDTSAGGDTKSEIDGAIPGVHYGTLFLPYVAVMAFFNYMNHSKNKKIDIFIIASIIISGLLFHLSRGEMLIYILSFIFIYTRYNKIKIKHVIFILIIVIGMFIGIMLIRLNKETIVFTMTENPYYSVFYSYIATCYANLNDLIRSNGDWHLLGDATLSPLWTITGMKDLTEITEINQLGMFNARTYLYPFYHDYKFIGIIVFPFIIGWIISMLYHRINANSAYWVLLLASMQKAIFVPFFGNYLFGEMVILFPYILILFVVLFIITLK